MASGKGLKRLAFFFVFLIPVAWYLFLQLFGENKFSLELISGLNEDCISVNQISVVYTQDSLDLAATNHFNRVKYKTDQRKIHLTPDTLNFFQCLTNDNDLALVSQEGVWGFYRLDREGVDILLAELDVLIMQKSYGEGVSR